MTQLFQNKKSLLSKREKDVLDLLVQGMSNKQIAAEFCLSEKTVEKHVTNLYQKLGVNGRSEAIVLAMTLKSEGRDSPHGAKKAPLLKWRKFSFMKRRTPMKRQYWFISAVAGFLLGLLAIGVGIPRMLMGPASTGAVGQKEEVLSLILNSHTKWATVKGEAEVVWYGPKGDTQSYINTFVIYQPLSAFVDVTNKEKPGFNEGLWVSDGENIYNLDKESKSYTQGKIPNFANDLSVLPSDLSQTKDDVVYSHPFSLLIPAPVKEYIYPEWFAQGNLSTAYSLLGEERILGRKTWIVNLQYKTGQATAWVDQETGMILKYVQEENGQKYVEVNFTSLEIDSPLAGDIFRVPSDYRLIGQG